MSEIKIAAMDFNLLDGGAMLEPPDQGPFHLKFKCEGVQKPTVKLRFYTKTLKKILPEPEPKPEYIQLKGGKLYCTDGQTLSSAGTIAKSVSLWIQCGGTLADGVDEGWAEGALQSALAFKAAKKFKTEDAVLLFLLVEVGEGGKSFTIKELVLDYEPIDKEKYDKKETAAQ